MVSPNFRSPFLRVCEFILKIKIFFLFLKNKSDSFLVNCNKKLNYFFSILRIHPKDSNTNI